MGNKELWQSVLAQIQFNISKANFATWFQNTEIISKEDEKVVISVPNAFSKEWLSNKYNKLILKTLHDIDDSIKELEFTIKPQTGKNTPPKIILANEGQEDTQLKFEEFKINKETNLNPNPSALVALAIFALSPVRKVHPEGSWPFSFLR